MKNFIGGIWIAINFRIYQWGLLAFPPSLVLGKVIVMVLLLLSCFIIFLLTVPEFQTNMFLTPNPLRWLDFVTALWGIFILTTLARNTHTHKLIHQYEHTGVIPSLSQSFPFVNITLLLPFIYLVNIYWAPFIYGALLNIVDVKVNITCFSFKQSAV